MKNFTLFKYIGILSVSILATSGAFSSPAPTRPSTPPPGSGGKVYTCPPSRFAQFGKPVFHGVVISTNSHTQKKDVKCHWSFRGSIEAYDMRVGDMSRCQADEKYKVTNANLSNDKSTANLQKTSLEKNDDVYYAENPVDIKVTCYP